VTLLDHFAERLSGHGDIARAAAALGRSPAWGMVCFKRICAELGEQAR